MLACIPSMPLFTKDLEAQESRTVMKPVSDSAAEYPCNLEEIISFLWSQLAYLSGSNAASLLGVIVTCDL